MHRDEALELLKKHLKNKNLVKHCLAVEACMRAMAARARPGCGKVGPGRNPARPRLRTDGKKPRAAHHRDRQEF